jgi:CRISPR-associated protein Csm3
MKIIKLTGIIELITGLHIGGGDDTMKIGGIDNGVIKDLNTNKPYIPGSSLKGKIRNLIEWYIGVVGIGDGNPFHSKLLENAIFKDSELKTKAITLLKLFGNGKTDKDFDEITPLTRISIGDCFISQDTLDKHLELSEAKYENSINRQTSIASNPRQTERVPAGVKFDFEIRVKVLQEDDETKLKDMVELGLDLLEQDYLGGSGSRGYGRVSCIDRTWSE